jgi:hypothetical protein
MPAVYSAGIPCFVRFLLTDKIIKDFDEFINELCGTDELVITKKKVKDHFRQLRDIEEFIRYRKELNSLIGGCHYDRYECKCGEYYEVYCGPAEYAEIEWCRVPMERTARMECKRSRHFCINCGEVFYSIGEIKFIRNVGSKKKLEFTEDINGII